MKIKMTVGTDADPLAAEALLEYSEHPDEVSKKNEAPIATWPPEAEDGDLFLEDKQGRQYLKNSVQTAMKTGQWAYEEINKREIPVLGKNTCAKVMEITSNMLGWTGLDKLAPTLAVALDTYVGKADDQLDKVLDTDTGKMVEDKLIDAASKGMTLASETSKRSFETVSNLRESTHAAVEKVTSMKEQAMERVQNSAAFVRGIPSDVADVFTQYTDYDGDGTVTIEDLSNTLKQAVASVQTRATEGVDQGIDYLLPQVGEEAAADRDDVDADEATKVSLRSKFMNRLSQRFQQAKAQTKAMATPYVGPIVGKAGITMAQQASKYVEYLQSLELKDLPIPEAAQATMKTSLDFASQQVTYVKNAFFAVIEKVDLGGYKNEINKPLENITPYFARLAQEKSIADVPADVVNIVVCLLGIRRGSPEVMHLTESIEKLMWAVCDVTILFGGSGDQTKDG